MRRAFVLLAFVAIRALGGTTPDFTTTDFTFSGVPNSSTLGSDGNLWLIDRAANTVGRLTPDGAYKTFAIPTPNAIAGGITLGTDGNAWFAEFGPSPNKIGRIAPDGAIKEFVIGSGKSLGTIARGPDGNVWFTESASSSSGPPSYFLGRISPADGSISDFALPTTGRAQGLVAGADGNLWVGWVESSGTKYDVLRVNTTGTLATFPLPSTTGLNALGSTMLLGPDLNVWFTYQNNLVRVKHDGTVALYPIPTANANMLPAGLVAGSDGNIWFTEFSSGKIAQLIVSSATDGGTATINESDTLGGLPQAMFLLPTSSSRVFGKTGADADTTLCKDKAVVYVVVSQDTTSSPPKFKKVTLRPYETCADVSVLALFSKGLTPTARFRVANGGKDVATAVRLVVSFTKENIPIANATATDGQCSIGLAGVSCTWATLDVGAKKEVVIDFGSPSIVQVNAWVSSAVADPDLSNNTDAVIWFKNTRESQPALGPPQPDVVNAPSR